MAIASARVIGPTRPANIMKMSQALPGLLKNGVIPVLNPTVPNAEVTSNNIAKKLTCSVIVSAMVTITTSIKEINMIEKAL